MKSINILEFGETVSKDDWCRPLVISYGSRYSDSIEFVNTYSGNPENNLKWVKFSDVFGDGWFNKTVKEITDINGLYEFVMGNLLTNHIL